MNIVKMRFINIQKSKIVPIFIILLLFLSIVSANEMSLRHVKGAWNQCG